MEARDRLLAAVIDELAGKESEISACAGSPPQSARATAC